MAAAKEAYAAGAAEAAAGRFAEAAGRFEAALARVPGWVEARLNLGACCYQLGQTEPPNSARLWLEKALAAFEAVGTAPTDKLTDEVRVRAALNRAATRHALGRRLEALNGLRELAAAHPRHRDVQYNLAVALLGVGLAQEAAAAVAAELAAHPDHAAARELEGRLRAASDAT
jgi:tetratricopeptide (TPR) repeat protein